MWVPSPASGGAAMGDGGRAGSGGSRELIRKEKMKK